MKTRKKIILHLCADIGSDTYYYSKNTKEYKVIKIGIKKGVENFNPKYKVYGVIANPVCTELSNARGGHIETDIEKGMYLVDHCLRIIKQTKPTFWVLENPATGKLRNEIGPPKHTYQPFEYGSPWTKKTALWGCFVMPPKLFTWDNVTKNPLLYVRPGRPKPSLAFLHKSAIDFIPEFKKFKPFIKNDGDFRSLCAQTFAKQLYNYNR